MPVTPRPALSPVPRGRLVYFIQCNGEHGPIKIGKSTQLGGRLEEFRVANPYPLNVLALVRLDQTWQMNLLEKRLQIRLAQHRVHGEWFEPSPPVLAVVEAANSMRMAEFCTFAGVDLFRARR